jgi:hypothetical protein
MGHFKAKPPKTGFNRPTATGSSGIDRVWKTVPIRDLVEGDIIAGMGIVKYVAPTCRADEYYLEAGEVVDEIFDAEEQVFAFVRKES